MARQDSPRATLSLGMARLRRRTDVKTCLVDGELVVLDRHGELIHQLNKTASYIWEQCDGRRTAAEIAGQLGEAFEVGGKGFWGVAEREKHGHHLEHVDPARSRIAQFNACASQLVTASSLPHSIAGC
jgi:hypothetical protein